MERNGILRICGTDYTEMTGRLLESASLVCLLESKGKGRDLKIAIKPNLVTCSPAQYGATTHPEIVEGIVKYLKENGFNDITIMEGSWAGDSTEKALEYCGYNALAEKYDLKVIDTKKEAAVAVNVEGTDINVCRCALQTDFLINVPVLKGHCQTKMTCALKNMKGLIPDSEKRRFHRLGLHSPIAYLNTIVHQDFIVVDQICGDPYFEEGGRPLVRNRILCGLDPVLIDTFAIKELGLPEKCVEYVNLSEALGVGKSTGLKVTDIGEVPPAEETAECILDVSYAVDDADSCSDCYAYLTMALNRLQEEGLLEKLGTDRISIGQGHRENKNIKKIGIGNCCTGAEIHVPGCPPDEDEIYETLKKYLESKE